MNSIFQIKELSIKISQKEVFRLLGYPYNKNPSAKVKSTIESLWPMANQLIQPKGIYRLVNQDELKKIGLPKISDNGGVGLCTIGRHLEKKSDGFSKQGEVLKALILDAFGSVAAEAAAQALNYYLCAEAEAKGYISGIRVSPGYGSWDIQNQKQLISFFPKEQLGIHLTTGMMMVPRKSISFATHFFSANNNEQVDQIPCKLCTLGNCIYRKVTN